MKQIFSLFSDYFALKDNFLTRMDPRGKLIAAITLILCVVVSTQVIFPLMIFVLCLRAMLLIRIPVGLIVGRSMMPVSIAAVVLLLRAILISGTTIAEFNLVGLTISVSREGLIEGILAASRILGAVSVIMLLN